MMCCTNNDMCNSMCIDAIDIMGYIKVNYNIEVMPNYVQLGFYIMGKRYNMCYIKLT